MAISTEKELGNALRNSQPTIEIEGDLKNKVLRIKATGHIAWVMVFALLAVAIAIILASGGLAAPVSSIIGAGAIAVLGLPAAISAVTIGVVAGNAQALNDLRDYTIVKDEPNLLVLVRNAG